nr:MAG TPA: hypothetical protein [Caudoviricetes sp.]
MFNSFCFKFVYFPIKINLWITLYPKRINLN